VNRRLQPNTYYDNWIELRKCGCGVLNAALKQWDSEAPLSSADHSKLEFIPLLSRIGLAATGHGVPELTKSAPKPACTIKPQEPVEGVINHEDIIEWDITPSIVHDLGNQQSRIELTIGEIRKVIKQCATVPGGKSTADTGESWPSEHCAITHCHWTGSAGLSEHLLDAHVDMFEFARNMHLVDVDRTLCPTDFELYMEAIKWQEQTKVPTVGASIDRRAHSNFNSLYNDQEIESLVCFCCARIQVKKNSSGCLGEIRWVNPYQDGKLFGMDSSDVEKTLGMATYLSDHGNGENRPNLNVSPALEELRDWTLDVPFEAGNVKIICCPEDHRCDVCCIRDLVLCEKCEVPVCRKCEQTLTKKKQPSIALSNDLWIGFIPEIIFKKEVTYMELLCASLVQPVMLNVVYTTFLERGNDMRQEGVQTGLVGDKPAKLGAKGNITAFMMPMDKVIDELNKMNESMDDPTNVMLPRTGEELSKIVVVTLMYMGDEPDAKIMSKSTVRRGVVLELIQSMILRGHRKYAHLDMSLVAEKARLELVPDAADYEPAVPREVCVVFEQQNFQAESGKAAAPDDPLREQNEDPTAFCSRGAVFDSSIETEENARDGCAYMHNLHELAQDENEEVVKEANNGSCWNLLTGQAISQLDATFMTSAYAFQFPYSIGCPDLKYQERDRKTGSPVVDFVEEWSQLMAQRVEGQLRRDLTFIFAVWNLVFRTMVNIGSSLHQVESASVQEQITAVDFKDAALTIMKALDSTYTTLDGRKLKVDGDLQKARYVQMVKDNPVAMRMLSSIRASYERIEGSQEIRVSMRTSIEAYRVFYGQPILVTFSPHEKLGLLVVRMHRVREIDPVHQLPSAGDC